MSFSALEESTESGQPVELYHFVKGTTAHRYTSSEDEIIFAARTYLPRTITRSDLSQSTEERRQEIEITLPSNDTVAQRFIGVVPAQPTTLTLSRFHRGDTEAFILWTGNIIGASFKEQGTVCVLRGVTTESAFSRTIPRFKYQGLCNHILYDSGCKLVNTDFRFIGTVSGISGKQITIPGLTAAEGAGWSIGGYINFGDDFRLIIGQSSDTLTLWLPFEEDPTGESVDVFAGCDHTLTTCDTKFSNSINYGGFAFVPILNPFESGLL